MPEVNAKKTNQNSITNREKEIVDGVRILFNVTNNKTRINGENKESHKSYYCVLLRGVGTVTNLFTLKFAHPCVLFARLSQSKTIHLVVPQLHWSLLSSMKK